MKHFLIEITFTVPFDEVEPVIAEHRAFLDIGYQKGILLCSGPKNPRDGGIVIGRSQNFEQIEDYFKNDPYAIQNVAFHRIVEFNPVKFQPLLAVWVNA